MITYYKNVFLLLTTVAVNVDCQYLLEEYAPNYNNYEPTKYALSFGYTSSEDSKHQLRRRNTDFSKSKEQIITDEGYSLYNRSRREGVYGDRNEKTERRIPEIDNTDMKYHRNRYASRLTTNLRTNPRYDKSRNVPDSAKPEASSTNSTSRNLSNRRRNDQTSSSNQKRIVKKENSAESHFILPTELKDIEYISNFNLNPVNIENIHFQNDQKFLHQLSSMQPQHFMATKQFFQTVPNSSPQPFQQQQQQNQEREKLIINVPDEQEDYTSGRQKQIQQGFSYIHNQPHVQIQLENIQKYITPKEMPQFSGYKQTQGEEHVQVYSVPNGPNLETVQYNIPDTKRENFQTRYTAANYQPEYETKQKPKEEDSGVIIQDGEPKYINYGYRHHQLQSQPQSNSFNQYNTQSNYDSRQHPTNLNSYFGEHNNYPQITEAQIKPNDKLNSQNHYPAILVHIDGKSGLPFYPTLKNIYNIPHESSFDYEGIPLVNLNKKQEEKQNYEEDQSSNNDDFRKEVYKDHYGYNEEEEEEEEVPNAQRRLYTGLTFHASSRNLYDGKTRSLRNPPPRHGDVIWQAGDQISDPQETLVRQLNETCAYIRFNETTPGTEDGTKPNIWQAGDYSAQIEEEELIRSVNITCENYTTDALNNFTSGYTIIDYCSQCANRYSEDTYEFGNQDEENVYTNSPELASYYQPIQENYEIYNNGRNYDQRLENGEIAGFYKRKRLAEDNSNSKKQ